MWKKLRLWHGVYRACRLRDVSVGPRVTVMPAPGKPFEVFAMEDQYCRRYAEQSIGVNPNDMGDTEFRRQRGGRNRCRRRHRCACRRAEGCGGWRGGGAPDWQCGCSSKSAYAARDAQRLYDIAYQQCMYAKAIRFRDTLSSASNRSIKWMLPLIRRLHHKHLLRGVKDFGCKQCDKFCVTTK